MRLRDYFRYYDTPDGQDLAKKLSVTMRYAALTGVGWGTYDVIMYSQPRGYGPILARYLWCTGPLVGMAATFTSVTFVTNKLRDEDDEYNYLIGGIAAGSVFGAWQKCYMHGFVGCLVLGTAAWLKKRSVREGWSFFPQKDELTPSSAYVNFTDFTLTRERPRNWTVDPKEA
jgi:NADH dehydrogenase (ubiquinone) 1 alpha subcomplex subunit 11